MSNKLLEKYISLLFETTRYTQNHPDELDSKRLSDMSSRQFNDKTQLSPSETIQDILKHIGPNTFISFVDKYDENIPSLGVSPKIEYKTPHGIYGYPLDKDSLRNMLLKAKPTESKFAVKRPYMHVYKITSPETVILQKVKDKVSSNKYTGLKGVKDALEDSKSAILNFLRRLDGLSEDSFSSSNKHLMQAVNENDLSQKPSIEMYNKQDGAFFVSYVYQLRFFLIHSILYSQTLESNKQNYFREVANDILRFLLDNIKESRHYKFIKDKGEGYPFFILYFVIRALTVVASHIIASGNLFVQLLNDVGIKAIIDRNTGTIHRNEPNQSFVSSLSPDAETFQLIGTYSNPLLAGKEELSKISDKVLDNFEMPEFATNLDEIYKIIEKEIEFNIHDEKAVGEYCRDNKYTYDETDQELIDSSITHKLGNNHSEQSVMNNLTKYFQILRESNSKFLIALLFTKSDKVASIIEYFLAKYALEPEQEILLDLIADFGFIKRKFDKE